MIRLRSFWAKGFRSLRDVRLDDLGAINVFYGENGSGKSNVLLALSRFMECAPRCLSNRGGIEAAPFVPADFREHTDAGITLGGVIELDVRGRSSLEFELRAPGPHRGASLNSVRLDGHDLALVKSPMNQKRVEELAAALRDSFALIDADRALVRETDWDDPKQRPQGVSPVQFELDHGRIQSAVFAANASSSRENRERVARLSEVLRDDLTRPRFTPIEDEVTSERYIVEDSCVDGKPVDRRIADAGFGVVQLYAMMIPIYLSGASVVAIEEPEAHLYAPRAGMMVRKALRAMVDREHVGQLFVATHSNLFDLDPEWFYEVSRDEARDETTVVKQRAEQLEKHLYDPGPIKRVLRVLLRDYDDPDRVMFEHPQAGKVTVRQLITHLDDDDAVALAYVRGLYAVSMEMFGRRARKGAL